MPDQKWDITPGELYDRDWLVCAKCYHWHQVTQEDLDGLNEAIPDPEHPNTVMLTTEPGNTCFDCGGELGEWIPRDAIGRNADGTYIYKGEQ